MSKCVLLACFSFLASIVSAVCSGRQPHSAVELLYLQQQAGSTQSRYKQLLTQHDILLFTSVILKIQIKN